MKFTSTLAAAALLKAASAHTIFCQLESAGYTNGMRRTSIAYEAELIEYRRWSWNPNPKLRWGTVNRSNLAGILLTY